MLSQLGHENVVKFKAVCQDPMAIMLEYVYFDIEVFGGEGKLSSLNKLMYLIDGQDCNGIEGTFMDKIAADVAGGLLYLYENEVVHRDLKLANVLVNRYCPFLLVFRLSKSKLSIISMIVINCRGNVI